jgi:replicative DNA helicase
MTDVILHNIEAEQALLGALILDNSVIDNIPDTLRPYHFAAEINSLIYDSICKINDIGSVADPITITAYLGSNEVFQKANGKKYLIDLLDSVIGLSNVGDYAKIIYDLYLRRQIVEISDGAITKARSFDDPNEVAPSIVESIEKDLYELVSESSWNGRPLSFGAALTESIDAAKVAYERDSRIVGVTSGFKLIDKWLGGLHNSDLLVIAGRPSMGKTALATNIAFNAAKAKLNNMSEGAGVIFFSLEMSAEQLATRILAAESGITSDSIRRGEIPKNSFDKLVTISQELEKLELYIDDTPSISVNQIRSRARKLKRKKDIGLIVIDYLQLVDVGGWRNIENRVQEISEITRALKGIAKELNVPVLALSQLSRAVEQREDKKPQLSDLRESGSIEQDADVVMFVFREEYYKARKEPAEGSLEHDKWQMEMEKIYNRAELIIAKQRHGPIGTIRLFFDGRLTRFGNLMDN